MLTQFYAWLRKKRLINHEAQSVTFETERTGKSESSFPSLTQ